LKKIPIAPIFIPANRLDFCDKAIKSGADGLIIDLEDSVKEDQKEEALLALVKYLETSSLEVPIFVRVNSLKLEQGKKDLKALEGVRSKYENIIVPKVDDPSFLDLVSSDSPVIALIESALAVRNLEQICSLDVVDGVLLGAADLSKSLGSDMSWDSLLHTRSKMIIEAAALNLMLIDSPFMNMTDMEGLKEEVRKLKAMGFVSKAAIHPDQINVIKKGLLPNKEEIEEAKVIIEAYEKSSGGVISVNGKMVDAPIVEAMKKRLSMIQE